jgi:hypothetical protein
MNSQRGLIATTLFLLALTSAGGRFIHLGGLAAGTSLCTYPTLTNAALLPVCPECGSVSTEAVKVDTLSCLPVQPDVALAELHRKRQWLAQGYHVDSHWGGSMRGDFRWFCPNCGCHFHREAGVGNDENPTDRSHHEDCVNQQDISELPERQVLPSEQ